MIFLSSLSSEEKPLLNEVVNEDIWEDVWMERRSYSLYNALRIVRFFSNDSLAVDEVKKLPLPNTYHLFRLVRFHKPHWFEQLVERKLDNPSLNLSYDYMEDLTIKYGVRLTPPMIAASLPLNLSQPSLSPLGIEVDRRARTLCRIAFELSDRLDGSPLDQGKFSFGSLNHRTNKPPSAI